MQDIDVITIHDKVGHVKPLKFKISENGIDIPVKINSAILYEHQHSKDNDTLRYKCMVVINDSLKVAELQYHIQTMKWRLMKI